MSIFEGFWEGSTLSGKPKKGLWLLVILRETTWGQKLVSNFESDAFNHSATLPSYFFRAGAPKPVLSMLDSRAGRQAF
jgi:hypothetical protein